LPEERQAQADASKDRQEGQEEVDAGNDGRVNADEK
jgi:hypothetical protein